MSRFEFRVQTLFSFRRVERHLCWYFYLPITIWFYLRCHISELQKKNQEMGVQNDRRTVEKDIPAWNRMTINLSLEVSMY